MKFLHQYSSYNSLFNVFNDIFKIFLLMKLINYCLKWNLNEFNEIQSY